MSEQSSQTPQKPGIRGDRIKALRLRRGLEQGQLAYRAKVDNSYIYRLEAGENPNVSAVILSRVARVLRTSTDYLVGTVDVEEAIMPKTTDSQDADDGLDPTVEALAHRVSALPPERRARVVGLAEEFLALLEEEPVESNLSEMQREMLAYFEKLNETNQEIALARLREILAEAPAQSDERRGARGTA